MMGRDDAEATLFAQLLRRVHVVVGHYRHHRQPLEPGEIAARVVHEYERRHAEPLARYRSMLEQAVHAFR